MSDVTFDSNSIDFSKKIGFIDMRMSIGLLLIIEVNFLLLAFLIVKDGSDAFHIDDSIDLSRGQLTEAIFAAGTNSFLIHTAFPLKIAHPLCLDSLLEMALLVSEG